MPISSLGTKYGSMGLIHRPLCHYRNLSYQQQLVVSDHLCTLLYHLDICIKEL
jgi:hypothetical protein